MQSQCNENVKQYGTSLKNLFRAEHHCFYYCCGHVGHDLTTSILCRSPSLKIIKPGLTVELKLPVPPNRGLIYDRNGVFAENRPVFSLEVIPEQVDDIEQTLADLTELMSITSDEIERFNLR